MFWIYQGFKKNGVGKLWGGGGGAGRVLVAHGLLDLLGMYQIYAVPLRT